MHTKPFQRVIIMFLVAIFLAACAGDQNPTVVPETASPPLASTLSPDAITPSHPIAFNPADYAFPEVIDPGKRYLFYLHGRIIEDQGLPAVSPDFGEYEYAAILDRFASYGFVVISDLRAKNTNSGDFAQKVADQVTALINAGVPGGNITVVGASKGGAIAILASNLLANAQLNFVIMAICNPEMVNEWAQNGLLLFGNVLSIYDASDELAGSCQELFSISEDKGLARHDEIILHIGTGHGILYQPLDEWILPTVAWAEGP